MSELKIDQKPEPEAADAYGIDGGVGGAGGGGGGLETDRNGSIDFWAGSASWLIWVLK